MTHLRRAWRRLGPNRRARFARARALGWAVAGAVAYPLGWWHAVAFVTAASLYANIESGFATGEAADNREIMDELREMRRELATLWGEVGAR